MMDAWYRDLGEPASEVFLHRPRCVTPIGVVYMADILLLHRRMHEVLPMVGYDPAMVLETMLQDKCVLGIVADDQP
jgi:hypothetical protein